MGSLSQASINKLSNLELINKLSTSENSKSQATLDQEH
jgi:hypothetical protein